MQFIAAAGGPDVPATAAEWAGTDDAACEVLYTAWTDDALVDVDASHLRAAVPALPYVQRGGVACLPLHIVEHYYGRATFPGARVRNMNVSYAASPATLARVEDFLYAADTSIFDVTSADRFAQRGEHLGHRLPVEFHIPEVNSRVRAPMHRW